MRPFQAQPSEGPEKSPALPCRVPTLTLRAFALAVAVALVWGTNPIAIHEGLKQFPPLGGAAIRFLMVAIPLMLLVPRPKIGLGRMAAYGLLLGIGLGLNNFAMAGHVSPGLASLLIQVQVALTIALELVLERRSPRAGQILALLLCSAGVLTIIVAADEAADALGVALMIGAASSWAAANMIARRSHGVSAMGMMIWSSIFAAGLLFLLSVAIEGPGAVPHSIEAADLHGWTALAWQALASSLFGYTSWNYLLERYSAGQVAPFALLVPVFGMAASALFIGEALGPAKLVAALLIVSGMAFALLRGKRRELPRGNG